MPSSNGSDDAMGDPIDRNDICNHDPEQLLPSVLSEDLSSVSSSSSSSSMRRDHKPTSRYIPYRSLKTLGTARRLTTPPRPCLLPTRCPKIGPTTTRNHTFARLHLIMCTAATSNACPRVVPREKRKPKSQATSLHKSPTFQSYATTTRLFKPVYITMGCFSCFWLQEGKALYLGTWNGPDPITK